MEEHLRPKELVGSSSLSRGTKQKPLIGAFVVSNLCLLLAKQSGKETRLTLVTFTALVLGNSTHDLIDVLTTASPGCLATLAAGNSTTHC